eukprot:gene53442-50435_t
MRQSVAGAAAVVTLAQYCTGHAHMTQPKSRMTHSWDVAEGETRTEFEPWSAGGPGGRAPEYSPPVRTWNSAHAQAHQVVVKGGALQMQVDVTAHHYGFF